MPMPMVHLATAREYAHDISWLSECPEFYLGIISPDAIHTRKNTEKKDKDITHLRLSCMTFPFVNKRGKDTDVVHSRAKGDLWKDNVINFLKQYKNEPNYNFLLGYGIHILTDFIWRETLFIKFELAYNNDSNPIQARNLAYYNDTDKIDFELYRIYKWRKEMWGLLEKATPSHVDGILTTDEIDTWNKRILHWFDSGESHHKNAIKYFSIEDLIKFPYEASKRIKQILLVEGL